jgi:hypothetical protein
MSEIRRVVGKYVAQSQNVPVPLRLSEKEA